MSDLKDFKITKNGVLKEYVGQGGDVVILEGFTSIIIPARETKYTSISGIFCFG